MVSSSVTVNIINTDGSQYQQPTTTNAASSNSTTIIIAVVVSVLSAVLIGVTTFLIVKKIRNRDAIMPESTADRSGHDIEIHKDLQVQDL